jgi:hypothetical protein
MHSTDQDVARRAYDLFVSRGGQHGHDVEDWLEAERQLAGAETLSRIPRRIDTAGRSPRTAGRARKRPA